MSAPVQVPPLQTGIVVDSGTGLEYRVIKFDGEEHAWIQLPIDKATQFGICEEGGTLSVASVRRMFPGGWSLRDYSRPKPLELCERMEIDVNSSHEITTMTMITFWIRDDDSILLHISLPPPGSPNIDWSDQSKIESLRERATEVILKYGHDDPVSHAAIDYDHNVLTADERHLFYRCTIPTIIQRAGESAKLSSEDVDDDTWFWKVTAARFKSDFLGTYAGPIGINPYEPKDWRALRSSFYEYWRESLETQPLKG